MRYLTLLTGLLVFGLCPWVSARQIAKTPASQEQDEIAALTRRTEKLDQQQQEILSKLDELKQLIGANAPRPASKPPEALAIKGEQFRGDAAAQVAIVEYADFQCPYCGRFQKDVYPKLFEDYINTGKAKYIYRDLPLPIHSDAMPAAKAARCAGEQGKFWEMHDSLFANQDTLIERGFLDRAQKLGLDSGKFKECLASDRHTAEIRASAADAQKMGITGTPTFFVGTIDPSGETVKVEKWVLGAKPYEEFKTALDSVLSDKNR